MDDLARIRAILLEDEQRELDRLRNRLADPEKRAIDVAEVLPEALSMQSADPSSHLARALEKPIERGLRSAIDNNTTAIADALYPVMGPAIRKSIAEALRSMMQSISQTLDNSFSVKGFKWRLESARTGVPFHEVVLRHTMHYRVEQVFLIHEHSGLLIKHLSAEAAYIQDPDAVSGMLSAIQDFATDSFKTSSDSNSFFEEATLNTIDVGEHSIWMTYGPQAMIACAIRGNPPNSYRITMQTANEQIHKKFHHALEDFDGEDSSLLAAEPILATCLASEAKESKERKGFSVGFILLLLAILGAIGWLGERKYRENQNFAAFVNTLQKEPGITVYNSKQGLIEGLRDPYSKSPLELAHLAGYETHAISLNFKPYQSLEAPIVLQRANAILKPPSSVNLRLDNNTIIVSGYAQGDWIRKVETLAAVIPGVSSLDTSNLLDPDKGLLKKINQALLPSENVSIRVQQQEVTIQGTAGSDWIEKARSLTKQFPEIRNLDLTNLQDSDTLLYNDLMSKLAPPQGVTLSVSNGEVIVNGVAPLAWIENANTLLSADQRVKGSSIDKVEATEQVELFKLVSKIETIRLIFPYSVVKLSPSNPTVADAIDTIKRFFELSHLLGYTTSMTITGHSDGDPANEANHEIAIMRASNFVQLLAQSIEQDTHRISTRSEIHPSDDNADYNRRIDFSVTYE